MEVVAKPGVDLGVGEPLASFSVDLGGTRLEDENVPSVLECCDVTVQGSPVVTDDDDPALGRKLAGDSVPLKAFGITVPGNLLLVIRLAEAFE
jgi:hypothetical protein